MIRTTLLVLLLAVAGLSLAADMPADHKSHQPAPEFDRKTALDTSQAAIGRNTSDWRFFDSQGNSRQLASFRGKPLVISLIYTSCYHICPTTTRHLQKVVTKARKVLGEESFNAITLGFDSANDTADAMRHFARQQSAGAPNWHFLASDQQTIDSFAAELGFQFFPSAAGFDHLVQTTILDAEGVVNRQVYGIQFDTPHLVEPLKQLVFGEKADQSLFQEISDKIRLFCTVYDPYSDSYQFDYSIFVGLFIGLSMGGIMLLIVIREWKSSNAARRDSSGS